MKAVLKEQKDQDVVKFSEMRKAQWGVIVRGKHNGHIVYRPPFGVYYAIDLTDGTYWNGISPYTDITVRILPAGTTI